ncbi:glycosyltransferase family 39 protein, partial [Candidatus Sumerlaeota bacterium]|nr:glycosyltransferase family 39 protein [Candidatus Sumerlaeota bacterium]
MFPLLVLAALCAPLYLIGSTGTGFRGTDELRYAQISKELGPGADLFLLRFNGVRYSDKPPLYFWMVDASNKAMGEFSPHGLRLPGMTAGFISVMLVYFMALLLCGNREVAFFSALMLMVMPRFLWILRWGRLDVPMCLFVYASLLFFIRSYFVTKARLGTWGFWMFLGLAFAIKGPSGPVVILGTVITFLIWRGEARRWRELVHWGGIAAALAMNLAWVLPIVLLGDTASSHDMVVNQNLGRIFSPYRHVRPPWYNLKNVWYDAFPAMLIVPGAITYLWVRRKETATAERGSPTSAFGQSGAAVRFLLSWIGFTFIFFSIYPPKRAQYLLPMYPAVAMLAGIFFSVLRSHWSQSATAMKVSKRYFRIPSAIALAVVIVLPALYLWLDEIVEGAIRFLEPINLEQSEDLRESYRDFEYGGYDFGRTTQLLGTLAVFGIMWGGIFSLWKQRVRAALGLILASTYALFFFFFGWIVPASVNDDEMRRFSEAMEAALIDRPDLAICMYGDDKPYYNIYGDYRIDYFEDDESEFRDFIATVREEGRPLIVIVREKKEKWFGEDDWYR